MTSIGMKSAKGCSQNLRVSWQPYPSWPDLLQVLNFYSTYVSNTTISSVLMQEDDKRQFPIYFTSKVLQGAEQSYQMIETLALLSVNSTRRLHPYFQIHQIKVKTGHPIKNKSFKR